MKEFIYLNTDYINSFLAQRHNGIPTSSEDETSNAIEKSKTEVTEHKTHKKSYNLGIPDLLNITNEIQPKRHEEINQISNTSFGREMITKIMHDNSYDMFLKDANLEKYTLIEDYMKIYDLTSLSNMIENEFIDMLKVDALKMEQDISKSLNREQKRNHKIKAEIQHNKEQNEEGLINIKLTSKIIKLLSKLFPSDLYVYTQNYFIPFKRKFFREEISSINYIYTSKTKILGKVTGTIINVLKYEEKNIFNAALNSLNEAGLEGLKLLGIKEDAKILIPISWYSE